MLAESGQKWVLTFEFKFESKRQLLQSKSGSGSLAGLFLLSRACRAARLEPQEGQELSETAPSPVEERQTGRL